jgi:hypothetical protein
MRKSRLSLLVGCVLILVSLCAQDKQEEVTVRGKLVRVAAIGGESTGWALHLDQETIIDGKSVNSIEATGAAEELAKMENKHVEAVGRIVVRHGVERGEWPVLEIRTLHEVAVR